MLKGLSYGIVGYGKAWSSGNIIGLLPRASRSFLEAGVSQPLYLSLRPGKSRRGYQCLQKCTLAIPFFDRSRSYVPGEKETIRINKGLSLQTPIVKTFKGIIAVPVCFE